MKNTLKITTAVLAIALFSGACNYLDTKPETNVKMEEAIENADDLVVATMGLYTAMRSTGYQGVALPVINDITTDIVTKMYQSPSNGHYDSYEAWTFNDNSPEIASLWGIMYATIDRAQRNIIKGKELLSTANEQESKKIHACLAQCYGVKSLTLFNLVNVFALPYNPATASEEFSGVPNIDEKIIEYTDKVERASVEKNYQQILGDLEKAKQEWDLAGNFSVTSIIQYEWMIMNKVAVSAVEARVRLYKQDYEGAKIAAQNVLDIKPGAKKMVYTESDYKNMWSTNVPNSEDIFTLGMNVNENQGTTSIGQFYGPSDGGDANPTYGGRLSPLAHAKIKEKTKDIRWSIIERDSLLHKRKKCLRVAKYNGDQNGKVSNIPVIRLPEIYLILAECENELGN
ncbi:MAG: RagB/SusD family nutrient uptake outer membrane protein, partial [Bacteroidales bacterium]|nr:RagB/SusD family nutrient uptake outer membrane protein [Bacteroidales bacterium]